MKPTINSYIGAPVSGDEARFLRILGRDLEGISGLILANFDTQTRQIDFVVVTEHYAALLELKNFGLPLFGEQNGAWQHENFAGERVRGPNENPYQQTKAAKFALSDEMLKFQKGTSGVPASSGRGYFTQFEAFVCIHPRIHAQSRVTGGDYKVNVASYEDVLRRILTESVSTTWGIEDWQRFATEHLHLTHSTLEEATDSMVAVAWEKLRTYQHRIETVIEATLPRLFSGAEDQNHGRPLINELEERRNFLLVGPSGATKTFHLHHLAATLSAKGEELPVLIEAKRFRGGDLWTVVRQGTAPFFRGDPRELLNAIKLCGLQIVLLVDALNECAVDLQKDLMRGVQAFVLQYECRVVFTSQEDVELTGDLGAVTKRLRLPNDLEKRAIYAHHADIKPLAEIDHFCSGFTNAYDLTIAGRCHNNTVPPESRAHLYDRYVHRCLPTHTAVASALLRRVASEMASTFSLVWTRDSFERLGERVLGDQQASLSVLDELRLSRLIQVTDDSFSFEHELLFDYFRAEDLRRNAQSTSSLAVEVSRPRNRDLIEFILPRASEDADIALIAATINDPRILANALKGACGSKVRSVLIRQCEAILSQAAGDLPNLELSCRVIETDEGKKRLVEVEIQNHRTWTPYTSILCSTIALSMENAAIQKGVLDLLDLTEWTFKETARKAASKFGLKPLAVWGELIRRFGALQSGSVQVPCCAILSGLRNVQMYSRYYKDGLPIRKSLRNRVSAQPDGFLSMLTLLEDLRYGSDIASVRQNLSLVRQAWDSKLSILRIDGLELLRSMNLEIEQNAPELLPEVREMLESFDTNNILINTSLLETMATYGALERPVSAANALAEMKAVIAPDARADSNLKEFSTLGETSPELFLAGRAYSCLSNIFEDVFQGAYYEAYETLSGSEKRDILSLAALSERSGFFVDWMLRELQKFADTSTIPIFERFAAGVDGTSISPQEAVAAFTLGIEGCAKWGGSVARYQADLPAPIQAWQTVGEILFRLHQGSDPKDLGHLWSRFNGDLELAAADVLYQLHHSRWRDQDKNGGMNLVTLCAPQVRSILEACLRHPQSLSTIFRYGGSRDPQVIRFVIDALAAIGNQESKDVLLALIDDAQFGDDAINAAELIQKRIHHQRAALPAE